MKQPEIKSLRDYDAENLLEDFLVKAEGLTFSTSKK